MPTEAENVQYLYLVLTNEGPPTIDWTAVGEVLDLKKGAVTKRWSRLKQAMEKGEVPGGTTYQFLWLCVKHSKRDKAMNWDAIAKKCNTTPGAASKRYSRMKQAFDEGAAPPAASPHVTPSKARAAPKMVPKTRKAAAPKKEVEEDEDEVEEEEDNESENSADTSFTPNPKRKRAPPVKKAPVPEQKFKPEADKDDASDEDTKPKRAKPTKRTVKPKPKPNVNPSAYAVKKKGLQMPTTEATTLIKNENDEEEEMDAFHDAREQLKSDSNIEQEQEQEQYDDADADARVHGWLRTSG